MKRVTHRWRRALSEKSPPWVKRAFGPFANYADMLLLDHGVFRMIYPNMHRLDSFAWRTSQPAPHQVRGYARRGVRTVVNLRGEHISGSYWLERDACARYGLTLVDFQVRSRAAPSREELRAARALFESLEYPMVMHCKSGADRAGLMSVLYVHLRQGLPIEEAKKQLSLRFGHIRQADTGILDSFFERYIEDNSRNPMPFFDWVEHVYDPDELKATFTSNSWANRLVDRILRRE